MNNSTKHTPSEYWEKGKENIFDNKKEKIKKITQAVSLSSIIILTWCDATTETIEKPNTPIEPFEQSYSSSIEFFKQDHNSPNAIMFIETQGRTWACNYSRIKIGDQVLKLTAKHCLLEKVNEPFDSRLQPDIVITDDFSATYRKIPGNSNDIITYNSIEHTTPNPLNISKLPISDEIIGEEVTVVGCLPWSKKEDDDYCMKLNGTIIDIESNTDNPSILIQFPQDYDEIIANIDENNDREWINWMSWSPVLDKDGNIVWVLARASLFKEDSPDITKQFISHTEYNDRVTIYPIPQEDGKLIINNNKDNQMKRGIYLHKTNIITQNNPEASESISPNKELIDTQIYYETHDGQALKIVEKIYKKGDAFIIEVEKYILD